MYAEQWRSFTISCTEKVSKYLTCPHYLGQEPLLAGIDPKARDGGGCKAGAVGGLLHATDLGHGPLLLVLLLGGGRHDVHVMLLLCQNKAKINITTAVSLESN